MIAAGGVRVLKTAPKYSEYHRNLRYAFPMPEHGFTFGPFVLDADRGMLLRDGGPVPLGHRGLCLLAALLAADGRVVAKADLMEAAWPGKAVEESNLSVQIAGLRKLLGPSPAGTAWIATVPRVGYRLLRSLPETAPSSPPRMPRERVDRPIIAVLPFMNLSGHGEADYLADGVSEDIISSLARYNWFQVISRNASFAFKGTTAEPRLVLERLGARYVVAGSVRRGKGHIRISVRLADAVAGTELWSDRYDLALDEVFAIQDEIAERVASAIEPELLRTEASLAVAVHTGNVTAWDLVRQGTWHFHQVGRETHYKARELFRGACRLDPQLPEAHIWRARVSAGIIAYGWSDDPSADSAEGLKAGLLAVRLDERDPYAHYALAIISNYSDRIEQARRAAERATELHPGFALGHLVLGMAKLFGKYAAEAAASLRRGLALSPHDPQNFVWLILLAHAELLRGQSGAALDASLQSLKIRPDWRPGLEAAVCCRAALGQFEQASLHLREMAELAPPEGDVLAPLWRVNPDWRNRREALLRAAAGK
jgi:TolB-like protein